MFSEKLDRQQGWRRDLETLLTLLCYTSAERSSTGDFSGIESFRWTPGFDLHSPALRNSGWIVFIRSKNRSWQRR